MYLLNKGEKVVFFVPHLRGQKNRALYIEKIQIKYPEANASTVRRLGTLKSSHPLF
jgi:hypothetical protein